MINLDFDFQEKFEVRTDDLRYREATLADVQDGAVVTGERTFTIGSINLSPGPGSVLHFAHGMKEVLNKLSQDGSQSAAWVDTDEPYTITFKRTDSIVSISENHCYKREASIDWNEFQDSVNGLYTRAGLEAFSRYPELKENPFIISWYFMTT